MPHDFPAKVVDVTDCPLAVFADKNGNQIATEVLSRRLERVRKANYNHVPFFRDKVAGIITTSWKDLVRIIPLPNNEEPKLQWCRKTLQETGIDKELICRIFRESVPAREPTVWEELQLRLLLLGDRKHSAAGAGFLELPGPSRYKNAGFLTQA